ncbi:SpvB/TcaC N-terminal domain-containing protein [Dokdonia sp.]|uniref:SpvB/TcaC N-terminal domain-containing protein n=1 Tax=Dokdonia sp. TaxID=2024995 RepID=UPI003267B9D1
MSRKSVCLFFLCILCLHFSYAQQAASGIDAITPTTPEAGALSRAGNVPINTATGQMSYSVPIHTISVNGNSWPVNLNYSYSGFIAETKPSLTGWGWNLNAYGVITKVVRGLPDFHPDGYYGPNNRKQLIDQYVATDNVDAMLFDDFMKFAENKYDSEADKFIVNIGGANFGFKIYYDTTNQEYKAHFLSKHNFKVDITMQNHPTIEIGSFVVTDDKGVKYYFDDDNREAVIPSEDPGHPYNIDKTTSWLLSKIEYLNGEEIIFNYTSDTYTSWDFSASAVILDGATGQDPNNVGYFTDELIGGYDDKMNQTTMGRQILSSISFPKGSLEFNTIAGPSGHTVFDSIILKDHTGTTVCDYQIDYQGDRDALVEVRKNNELLFGFDYYGLTTGGIPGFYEGVNNKPLNQDLWGFYNGSHNNTEAIDYALNEQIDKSISLADTRKGAMSKITYPTGGYTLIEYQQNTVKKLYGDSNLGGAEDENVFNNQVFLELDAKLSNNERHTEVTKTFSYPVRANLTHRIIGNVASGNAIYVTIERLDGPDLNQYNACYQGTPTYHGSRYPVNVEDARNRMIPPDNDPNTPPRPCDNYYPNPVVNPAFIVSKDPDNNCPYWNVNGPTNDWFGCTEQNTINQQFNSTPFWIPAGTYRFVISTHTNGNPHLVSNLAYDELFADMRLQYYLPPGADEQTDVRELFVNDPTGGIRVTSIKNYDAIQGDATNTILYNYQDEDGFSTAQENQIPSNVETHHIDIILNNGDYYQRKDTYYRLNSFGAMDAHNGIPVYYKKVRKYYAATIANNGNDQDNPPIGPIGPTNPDTTTNLSYIASGVEEYQYQMPLEDRTYKYPPRPIHLDKSKAKIISSKMIGEDGVIAFEENSYALIRPDLEIDTGNPQDFSLNHPWSFKIAYKQVRLVNELVNCYQLGNTDCFEAIRELYEVTRYKEIESYFDITYKQSMKDQIITTQEYQRDPVSDFTLIKEQKITNSKGETRRKVFEYPKNRTDESQYQSMVNRNQISTPVIEKTYLNDQIIGSQKTDYIFHINGYHLKQVKANKGAVPLSDLETIYTIDSYDSNGNISQTHREDGQAVAYLWGYNKQYPVAKVENATIAQVLGALDTGVGNIQSLDGDSLRSALHTIRQGLPNALVTTYTYKPLVGVSSVTDPRGYTMFYEYDLQNRLEYVKDENGKVYSKNEYRYGINN